MTRREIYEIHNKFSTETKCSLCPYGVDDDCTCLAEDLIKGFEGEDDE